MREQNPNLRRFMGKCAYTRSESPPPAKHFHPLSRRHGMDHSQHLQENHPSKIRVLPEPLAPTPNRRYTVCAGMPNVTTNSIQEARSKSPANQIQIQGNEPKYQNVDYPFYSTVCRRKMVVSDDLFGPNLDRKYPNLNRELPNLNRELPNLNRELPNLNRNKPVLPRPILKGFPQALSASASNTAARSNSPKPATPHPSVSLPDNPSRPTHHASSGTYFPRPDPSCSSRIPQKSRQPKRLLIQQLEETFFLSSTKTFVVSNWSRSTQYMEDFPSVVLHLGVSLQLRNSTSAQTSRSNRWDS
jgi:hypothetical protein